MPSTCADLVMYVITGKASICNLCLIALNNGVPGHFQEDSTSLLCIYNIHTPADWVRMTNSCTRSRLLALKKLNSSKGSSYLWPFRRVEPRWYASSTELWWAAVESIYMCISFKVAVLICVPGMKPVIVLCLHYQMPMQSVPIHKYCSLHWHLLPKEMAFCHSIGPSQGWWRTGRAVNLLCLTIARSSFATCFVLAREEWEDICFKKTLSTTQGEIFF